MEVAVVGVNHKVAPIAIREKVAFSEAKKIESMDILLDYGIEEVVILSTCNRSEIYIATKDEKIDKAIEFTKSFYESFFKITGISDYLFIEKGKKAIEHLYCVAAGLDSIVLGEDQILGQVSDAHLFAMEFGGSKKILNKMFREAITTAKEIKQTTKMSEVPLSVSYIGVKYLKQQMGTLKGKKALVVGLGEMGRLAFQHLIEEGVEEIYMCNRNHDKVYDLSSEYSQIIPVAYELRYDYLKDVDIVVTATASPHTVIQKSKIKALKDKVYMMDLALPRDIDASVNELEEVILFDIDDLTRISHENEQKREALAAKAMEMVKMKIEDFMLWCDTIKVDPVIQSLNQKCKEIEEDTLSYIYRKMDLDCREKKILEKMISSALSRVIREPVLKLKSIEEEEKRDAYIQLMGELFEI